MVIYRYPSGSDGIIISYGGYKWFKEVYSKPTNRDKTFIEWINQWKDDHIVEEDILNIYNCDKKDKIKI